MDTEVLRWFQQVADGVTVTELSEVERLTQPGVSRALARLETEVGTQLLRRSGRRLRLTRAGAVFRRHVDALLHELDDGLAAVAQVIDPETGTVTLGFPLTLGTWLVPDLLASFRLEHPQIQFELRQRRDELLAAIRDDERADIEISTVRPRESAWNWQLLLVEPLRLAVPRDHPLASAPGVALEPVALEPVALEQVALEPVALEQVAAEPFVVLRTTSRLRQIGESLTRAAGFSPQVAYVAADVPTAYGFVAAGLGVAILPPPHQGAPPGPDDPVRFLEIAGTAVQAQREVGMVWSARQPLLPAADYFRAHVQRRVTANTMRGVFASPGRANTPHMPGGRI